jgi:ribosomal protein S18 acetylase RimI-like enzyme
MLYISTDKSRIDFEKLSSFLLKESYWAQSRTIEQLKSALENSRCYCLIENDEMLGFARVITDFGVFAYLADVYIEKEHRGKGYGKMLMEEIINDPKLKLISRWMLGTLDAHGLYQQYGFTELKEPKRWMEYLPKGSELS